MKSLIDKLARREALARFFFFGVLLVLEKVLKRTVKRFPSFRERLREKDLSVQIRLKDNSLGRYYVLKGGKVSSERRIHRNPDVTVIFGDTRLALNMLVPPRDRLAMVNAMKNFQMGLLGNEEQSSWFMETSRPGGDAGSGPKISTGPRGEK